MFKRIVFVFVAMTTLAACAGTKTAKVTGTVTYLQRIALPENAVVKVTLEDISKADAAAVVLGEQEIKTAGKSVPFAFEISYNPVEIVATHTYNLRATISDAEGELLFSSDTATLVITNGAPTEGIEIIVKPAGASATGSLIGTVWKWASFQSPTEQFDVDTPEKYTLEFNTEGHVGIGADCNRGQASYSVDGTGLQLVMGPMTLAACPEGSRSDAFLRYLGQSASYFFEDGNLYIDLAVDSGTLKFIP